MFPELLKIDVCALYYNKTIIKIKMWNKVRIFITGILSLDWNFWGLEINTVLKCSHRISRLPVWLCFQINNR